MQKRLGLILILTIVSAATEVFGQSTVTAGTTEEKAETVTFPQWAKDFRRADIVAFGVFPFAWLVTVISVDLYRSAQHNWSDARYYPWPMTADNPVPWTNDEYKAALLIAGAMAISIAITDFIIVKIKRNKAAARARAFTPDPPTIIRTPLDGSIPPEDAASEENEPPGEAVPGEISGEAAPPQPEAAP
ncbi:MAG: hypothetical protein LBD22_03665 [Spirochaetaceae bacterium]|jgi:hypothetical protein|nr:hypothetical protein [Spirochaetaceae bacterium]